MVTAPVFNRYTLHDYVENILEPAIKAGIVFTEMHVHATDKPTKADFYKRGGLALCQSMWRFHTQTRGWSDIGQHATIDPDGYIWACRNVSLPPASSTGFNDSDNDRQHPFMFEMIGQFDVGNEVLEGPQLAAALGLCKAWMVITKRDASGIKFHREMDRNGKTCPGSSINKAEFVDEVKKTPYVLYDRKDPNLPSFKNAESVRFTLDGVELPSLGFKVETEGGGVTYIPARVLSEALGLTVIYNAATNTVALTRAKKGE